MPLGQHHCRNTWRREPWYVSSDLSDRSVVVSFVPPVARWRCHHSPSLARFRCVVTQYKWATRSHCNCCESQSATSATSSSASSSPALKKLRTLSTWCVSLSPCSSSQSSLPLPVIYLRIIMSVFMIRTFADLTNLISLHQTACVRKREKLKKLTARGLLLKWEVWLTPESVPHLDRAKILVGLALSLSVTTSSPAKDGCGKTDGLGGNST